MIRRVATVALAALALGSCGDAGSADIFVLRLRAASGMEGAGPPIVLGSVDRIDLAIDPAENVRFDPVAFNPPPFEGGDVVARISSAGEYVISFQRAWIERNQVQTETSWYVDVPLYVDGVQQLEPMAPSLRVLFNQFTADSEELIGEARRTLTWPPEPGSTTTIPVLCRDGLDDLCTTASTP